MIKKLFTNRWVIIALGFIFLDLLIWFIGPLFGFGESRPLASVSARLIFIVFILLVWIGYELYKYIAARQASKKLMEGMTEQAPDSSDVNAAAEIEMLRKRIDLAVSTLKKSSKGKSKWGGEYLYQTPWYMFIGAPGSGKTTALINCGLRFPVSAGGDIHAIKGVGGTRNCDWWFTDDAIFLDTAGRYTTQESDKKADSRAWLGFLEMLKKIRSRRPLNGAIVTVSISDLLGQSENDRDAYAVAVGQRIQELYQKLGVNFPIYLMVTKTDLLAGFMEYFSNLGSEERAQILGTTFPYAQSANKDFDFQSAFKKQFDEIVSRLNTRLIDRMQIERDIQRRTLLYGFPQQFSMIGPILAKFIEQVFGGSKFEQKPLLRGVYFTSGTQEGTPIDRVLGSLSRMLKMERKVMPPMVATGKSFFLTKLLKELIFPESDLVGFDEKKEKKRKLLVRGAYACLGLFSILFILAWTISYFKNEALIKDIDAKIAVLAKVSASLPQPESDDLNTVIPFLNEIRNLPYGYANREKSSPWGYHYGLFQGEKLGDLENEAYNRSLRTVFLPRLALFLEDQIRNSTKNEIKYEALKAYLMLFDDKHLDPVELSAFLAADWEQTSQGGSSEDSQKDFVNHLNASLEKRPINIVWNRDDALIANARLSLAASSLAERVYSRVRLLGVSQSIQPVKLSDLVGPAGTQIMEREGGEPLSTPLPAIFTYSGYHDGFNQAVDSIVSQMADEDSWVLGEQSASSQKTVDKAQLLEAVRHHYLEEYVKNWDEVLASIRLKKSASLADTAMYARTLSGADSPLKKLLVGIVKEVSLTASNKSQDLKDKAEDKIMDSAKAMAARLLSSASVGKKNDAGNKPPESLVDDHYDAIRQLVTAAAPGQPMPIDQTISLLNDFYQEVSAYASAGQGGSSELKPLASSARLKAEADRMPAPLGQILKSLVIVTTGQAAAVNKDNIHNAISGASTFCEKAISGRFPINRASPNEIMVADFNSIFSPGGELDNFFNSNLKQVVDTSSSLWKVKPEAAATSPISEGDLHQFQNADAIRRAFFHGGNTASVTAELRLVSSDLPQVTLEYGGETHQFSPSNSSAMTLRWPAQNGGGAKLFASNPGQGIAVEGDWAIFRLIEKAMGDSSVPERLRLVYMLEGKRVTFELRASSVLNPFKLKELGGFRCPGRN